MPCYMQMIPFGVLGAYNTLEYVLRKEINFSVTAWWQTQWEPAYELAGHGIRPRLSISVYLPASGAPHCSLAF